MKYFHKNYEHHQKYYPDAIVRSLESIKMRLEKMSYGEIYFKYYNFTEILQFIDFSSITNEPRILINIFAFIMSSSLAPPLNK